MARRILEERVGREPGPLSAGAGGEEAPEGQGRGDGRAAAQRQDRPQRREMNVEPHGDQGRDAEGQAQVQKQAAAGMGSERNDHRRDERGADDRQGPRGRFTQVTASALHRLDDTVVPGAEVDAHVQRDQGQAERRLQGAPVRGR